MQSTPIITGGCLCGSIRYEAAGEASDTTHCHCRTCRRASGAAFVTWASFAMNGFKFTRARPASYHSSENVRRSFCSSCGTPLTYRRLDLPDTIDVTLGSMDDPDQLRPEDHTWTESRLSWIVLADGLPAYARERRQE
jgi:hypothetical protein